MLRYGSLQNVLDNAEKINRVSIRDSVLAGVERAMTNYQLIKLQKMDELPFALNELVFEDKGITTNEVLYGIGLKQ